MTILRDEVAEITVDEIWPAQRDSDTTPSFAPVLVLRNGERLQLVKWHEREKTEAFTDWLRGELQIAPLRKATV